MSDPVINDLQAQWLSSQRCLSADALNQARYHCQSQVQFDLCALLEQHGQITPVQAASARQAAQSYRESGAWSPSQDFIRTHSTPLASPGANADAMQTLKTSIGPNALQIMQNALKENYAIERIAGQGGMGVILKAYRVKDQEPVAIKVLSETAAKSLEAKRFQREARLLQGLKHENIARVFEYGKASEIPYFVMEWVEGPDLEEKIREFFRGRAEAFTYEELTLFLADVADALVYCHSEGLIHRDIKPSNILILSDGRAKLIDFGLVKRDQQRMDSHSLTLSKSDEALGTPAFMAPEQVDPKGDFGTVCPATDVWGLGTTLFYALTGSPPYEGETITNLYIKLLTQDPPKLSDINPDLPAALSKLCEDCMQKKSSDRITIEELAERLREFGTPEKTRNRVIEISLGIVFISLALCLFFLLPPSTTLKAPTATVQNAITNEESVLIEGQCQLGGVVVKYGEESTVSDSDGSYLLRVPLKEGLNKLTLTFQFEDQQLKESIEVRRDSRPPLIDVRLVDNKIVIDEQSRIRGSVKDESPVDLWINKENVTIDENGQFEFQLRNLKSSKFTIQILAQDQAGNRYTEGFDAITGTQYYYEQSKSILAELQRWDFLNDDSQDRLIRALSKHVDKRFQFIEMRRFKVGGQSHRIASFRHSKTDMIFQLIPGGRYRMGLDYNKRNSALNFMKKHQQRVNPSYLLWEQPDHSCLIRKPFFLSQTEVSRAHWNAMAAKDDRVFPVSDLPMSHISWPQCVNWLSLGGLRLPSEAEWEYGCRSGTVSRFFWGDEANASFATVGSPVTPVTFHLKKTNAFGLADMCGNVWEWCQDGWISNYKDGPKNDQSRGTAKTMGAVFRGGAARNSWGVARSTYRDRAAYGSSAYNIGFRAAADVFPD